MKKLPIIIAVLLSLAWFLPSCASKKKTAGSETTPQTSTETAVEPQPDPRASYPYIYVQDNRFFFQGKEYTLKGVNYYPVRNNWRRMWEVWDTAPMEKELSLLSGLGVNTVRVFLDYNVFEKHRKNGQDSIMLSRLDELLAIIDKNNMRALITPFVWGRGELKTDKLHIEHIASRYKDDARIFGWDISNELDHCWISDTSKRAAIQNWAAGVYESLRSVDTNHLITVGDYGWYLGDRDDPYGTGISLDLSLMSLAPEKQDFICFHWYGHYYALETALQKLTAAVSKPVVVEEIGLPTGGVDDTGNAWFLNEEQVAGYYKAWMETAEKYKAYLMPWCGFDYDAGYAPFSINSNQLFFGLFAADYRIKANGSVFKDDSKAGVQSKTAALPVVKECKRRDK